MIRIPLIVFLICRKDWILPGFSQDKSVSIEGVVCFINSAFRMHSARISLRDYPDFGTSKQITFMEPGSRELFPEMISHNLPVSLQAQLGE